MTRSALTTSFPLIGATALALALVASAPAMAGCHSVMATEVDGNDGDYDTHARDGAYWGLYALGDGHEVFGTVAGCGTQVVTGSLGYGTSTHVDVDGIETQVGIETRSGGQADVFSRGDGGEIAVRAAKGSSVSVQNHGDNSIRVDAQ